MDMDKEILDDFRAESMGLIDELEGVVDELEEAGEAEFPAGQLRDFSQKIDRIMGAAKTLLTLAPGHPGITFLADISEMCKTMGYQAAALQRSSLVPIFAGFWAETLEMMREVFQLLASEAEVKALVEKRSALLRRRLEWLAEKVAPDSEEEKQKVVALLKRL